MAASSKPTTFAPRWMRIVLGLSLALNLAVAGLAIGSAWKWSRDGGPPRSVDLSLGPLSRALGPEDRRAVIDRLRDEHGQRPDFREIRRNGEALAGLLRAEEFDVRAFAAELDRIRLMAGAFQQAGQDVLVEQIAGMTPQERQALADRFEEQSRRRPEDGSKRGESRR